MKNKLATKRSLAYISVSKRAFLRLKFIIKNMEIGIISDSHDHVDNIKKAVQIFKDRKIDLVFHLGDYVAPSSVRLFKGVKVIGIFGNNDGEQFRVTKAFGEIDGEIKEDFCEINKDYVKFALYHGKWPEITEALLKCGKYDVVLYGHDHNKLQKKVGKTISLNPGTAHGFGKKCTIAIFDTKSKKAEFVEL